MVSLNQVDSWISEIENGRRTDAYLEYFLETGSDQILEFASISTFSGAIGGGQPFLQISSPKRLLVEIIYRLRIFQRP